MMGDSEADECQYGPLDREDVAVEADWCFDMNQAPRDGTRFLVTNGEIITVGFFVHGHAFAVDSWCGTKYTVPIAWQKLPKIRPIADAYNQE